MPKNTIFETRQRAADLRQQERENEAVQRLEIIGAMLDMVCSYSERDPYEGGELRIKISVWNSALEDIPTKDLLPTLKAEMRQRTNKFPITPADLNRRFRGEEEATDESGKTTRETRANVACYEPWPRPDATPALPEPLPKLAVEPEELKAQLSAVAAADDDEKAAQLAATVRQSFSDVQDLADVCNVDLERLDPQQLADLRAFAVWWVRFHPRERFSAHAARRLWPNFEAWRENERAKRLREAGRK